jgi:hypothetical protein
MKTLLLIILCCEALAQEPRITPYYEIKLDGRTVAEACGDRVYFGKSWKLVKEIFPGECREGNHGR